jgi:hypothetical protein
MSNGVLLESFDVHCQVCERPQLGLGPKKSDAVRYLRSIGWKKHESRWHCYKCAPKVLAENKDKEAPPQD